ncbi:hypothetical protein AQ914_18240 [Burkholderia pseudomallei]|uniref:hypothetical protein n=1 Tax=Burkholderia pseudomallei TaxID=28450 RepID=UPI000975504C|nr:hypothetical protein [Burkholderia pseudomallei]ONC41629.1 hypothetical protein AQ914_18240 [Burkholderia pseudomallei]
MRNELLAAVMRSERPVKLALCTVVAVGGAGWAIAAASLGYIGALRGEVLAAQHDATDARASIDFYKQVAAKAYTQMLVAKGHAGDSGVLIPVGTRVECNMTYTQVAGKTVGHCEGPLLLPPRGYVN